MCVQPLAYMAVHMTGVVMTFLLARVFWESFRAHTFFLLFILCISVWNGAGAPYSPSLPSVPLSSSVAHRTDFGRHVVCGNPKKFPSQTRMRPAGFYFNVFASRYLKQLEQKAKTASPASLNGSMAPKKVL